MNRTMPSDPNNDSTAGALAEAARRGDLRSWRQLLRGAGNDASNIEVILAAGRAAAPFVRALWPHLRAGGRRAMGEQAIEDGRDSLLRWILRATPQRPGGWFIAACRLDRATLLPALAPRSAGSGAWHRGVRAAGPAALAWLTRQGAITQATWDAVLWQTVQQRQSEHLQILAERLPQVTWRWLHERRRGWPTPDDTWHWIDQTLSGHLASGKRNDRDALGAHLPMTFAHLSSQIQHQQLRERRTPG